MMPERDQEPEPFRDLDRVKVKLWQCIYYLSGSGTIQARLAEVFMEINSILEHQIPEEIVDDFAFCKHRLTNLKNKPISNEEGVLLARKILSMYTKLRGGIS
jgi:hypothetical protein